MMARVTTWWVFFRISLEERLVYRGDFALGTLMRFLPIVTQIFLWYAIFEAASAGIESTSNQADVEQAAPVDADSNQPSDNTSSNGSTATNNPSSTEETPTEPTGDQTSTSGVDAESKTIADYSFRDIVAYYLLAMIARAFSSMPGLTTGIAKQIQTGEVKKFLIQPVDLLGCLLVQRVAHKLVYYIIALAPFAFVFYLCRGYFVNGWPSPEVLLAFFLSLIMAFLLGYFMEACMGLVGFWFLEVTSLTFVYMLFNFFLSGHMFPLEMLPTAPINFQWLVDLLPLKYMAYYPAAIFLGKIDGEELWLGLLIEFAWLLFFIVLARFMWARGVKRYSGFGG